MKWIVFVLKFLKKLFGINHMSGKYPSLRALTNSTTDEEVEKRVTGVQILRDKKGNILCVAIFLDGHWKLIEFNDPIINELKSLPILPEDIIDSCFEEEEILQMTKELFQVKIKYDEEKKNVLGRAKSKFGKN